MCTKSLVIALVLFSSAKMSLISASATNVGLSPGLQPLTHWSVAGPFKQNASGPDNSLDEEFLKTAGATATPASWPLSTRTWAEVASTEGSPLDFNDLLGRDGTKPSHLLFYASTRIEAQDSCNGYLCAGADDALTIWLNGQVVFADERPRKFFCMENLVTLQLAKGTNVLVFRVRSLEEGSQRIQALIGLDWQEAVRDFVAQRGAFLENGLSPDGKKFSMAFPAPPPASKATVSVRCAGGPVEGQMIENTWVPADPLREGLYTMELKIAGASFQENIFVGDSDNAMRKLAATLGKPARDMAGAGDRQIIKRRLEILFEAKNQVTESRDWRSRVVFTLREAYRVLSEGDGAAIQPEGLHLRGFISEIDGQSQGYRIFIPHQKTKQPIALAVLVPTATSADRPFIESVFTARQVEAERWASLAQEVGIGILWMGYHCQPYGNPIEFAHFDEVFADVVRHYQIDPTRVYLMGTCRAGMTATMVAAHWPHRFAGLGLVDPIIHRNRNRSDEPDWVRSYEGYRSWLNEQEPFRHLSNLTTTPIFIIHDGTEVGHGTLKEAEEFRDAVLSERGTATLLDVHRSVLHLESWQKVMVWLFKQRREVPSADPTALTGRNEGPVSMALAEPFYVVEPTQFTTPEEAEGAQTLNDQFMRLWKVSCYGECRKIKDTAVSDDIRARYNLVLLGSPRGNTEWARLQSRLPINLEKAGASIFGSSVAAGEGYGIQAVARNPDSPGRRVVLIGGYDMARARVGELRLPTDGWFDYALWRAGGTGTTPDLIVAQTYPRRSNR